MSPIRPEDQAAAEQIFNAGESAINDRLIQLCDQYYALGYNRCHTEMASGLPDEMPEAVLIAVNAFLANGQAFGFNDDSVDLLWQSIVRALRG